jgi:hypothetical protein
VICLTSHDLSLRRAVLRSRLIASPAYFGPCTMELKSTFLDGQPSNRLDTAQSSPLDG